MDNMHGNLRFYYVQQPCLDYVLFLGFFEVISFSLSDIRSGLMGSIRGPRGWDDWPPHSRSRVDANLCSFLFSCYFLKKHVLGGERGGGGGLFHYGWKQVLIIVDMILSWKILWFQRVSEHVLELGHYEIKESKVCITHFDCVKKITYSIHFIIQYSHESILVLLISSYWLILMLFRCIDVISCFVFAKKEKREDCFCDSFEVIPQRRC